MVRSKRAKISVKDAGSIPSPEHVSESIVNRPDHVASTLDNNKELSAQSEKGEEGSIEAPPFSPDSRENVSDDRDNANIEGSDVQVDHDKHVAVEAEGERSIVGEQVDAPTATHHLEVPESQCDEGVVEKTVTSGENESSKEVSSLVSVTKDTLHDENKSSTSDDEGTKEMRQAVALHFSGLKRPSSPVDDTYDEDAPIESEMFESRQQFLNYCQTTHCQFDELRRAKHSTIMVLFQLHNPMAPKFLQQCGACYRDITHGIRYHCQVCVNFDLCQDCFEPVTSGLWAKRDARFAHDKKHQFTPIDLEAMEETQKIRAERQKSLKAHIELLEHAGTCSGPPGCSLQNCQRLKKLFLHVPTCDVRPKKDCKICTRLLSLCTVHARNCSERGHCPIPFCDRIRERNRRLRRQQELMDDRRRQAQNELYQNLSSTFNI
jgi:E1A/CREB-binding protein